MYILIYWGTSILSIEEFHIWWSRLARDLYLLKTHLQSISEQGNQYWFVAVWIFWNKIQHHLHKIHMFNVRTMHSKMSFANCPLYMNHRQLDYKYMISDAKMFVWYHTNDIGCAKLGDSIQTWKHFCLAPWRRPFFDRWRGYIHFSLQVYNDIEQLDDKHQALNHTNCMIFSLLIFLHNKSSVVVLLADFCFVLAFVFITLLGQPVMSAIPAGTEPRTDVD